MNKITRIVAWAESMPPLATPPPLKQIWPILVVPLGLGLTAAWICALGYGVAKLIEKAI